MTQLLGGYSANQNDQPPFIEFYIDSEEDREATLKAAGQVVMRDVHMVSMRQRGSQDTAVKRVSEWLVEMRLYSSTGRQPADWAEKYEAGYERWKKDMDGVDLNGYDLRKWPGVTKAQLHNLRQVGIVTVEDVAAMTQTVIERVGLGGQSLRGRAIAWLQASKGAINPEEVSQLRDENKAKGERIAELERNIAEINAKLGTGGKAR